MIEKVFSLIVAAGVITMVAANGLLLEVVLGILGAVVALYILMYFLNPEARIGRRQRQEARRFRRKR